ncbi:MAG: Hpt domain-containing protein [Epsilonproteobacteria bacterium]|nr:hypothetical protein [Campylobacterota bacterium]NPA56487.1 Hpt domain-containing protein [Campylobacterota bacterium]
MVLYDEHKRLIAISDKTLEMLGFRSIEEFKRGYYDIAQLFVKRSGYVHEFKSFHWIDYCLTNSTVTHRAIVQRRDGGEIEVFVNISILNGIEGRSYYLITLEPNTFNECLFPADEERTTPPPSPYRERREEVEGGGAPPPPCSSITIEPKEFERPNLAQIGEELDLEEKIVKEFVQEYIQHALESLDQLNGAIEAGDIKTIKNIIHTLRGVSTNLRLKPAQEILSRSTGKERLEELVEILKEFYSYILFLAQELGVEVKGKVELKSPPPSLGGDGELPSHCSPIDPSTKVVKPQYIERATKELGLSFEEYQSYLRELINEIKINLAYNNYAELHKLASFARNLYLQECAKYLDEVSINQNPDLVKRCLQDLEELKREPNPFLVTAQDLREALDLIQIDKRDFIEILEDLLIELKTLRSVKMKREQFLKKARQLKSVAESMRLSNLVLLLNNLITNYPLDNYLAQQLDEAILSLENSLKEIQG